MSNIASPGIFKVFVVFEHPDGRALGAAVVDMWKDLTADLVVFDGVTTRHDGVAYSERKEGEAPTPGTWHY